MRSAPKLIATACALQCVWWIGACAPQSPDASSWRDQAWQALNQVSSNVSTSSLLLEQLQKDRVLGSYAQIVALNSETNAGKVTSKFSDEQPAPSDSATYREVTGVLSDAGDVLSQVRIAVVRRDSAAYPSLLRQLSRASRQLSRTEQHIGGRTG